MGLRISFDRSLPVSVKVQLKGQIEFGIVSGALKPGEQLPSVRDLAAAEGIAHVTVSHVYSELTREGLVVIRRGKGAFVADVGESRNLAWLQRSVDHLLTHALRRGFTPAQISRMVTARLATGHEHRPVLALVGLFAHATGRYAEDLAALLADLAPLLLVYTQEQLRAVPADLAQIHAADLVIASVNQVKDVQALLSPHHPPVHGLSFALHAETVANLRAIPSEARIGVISTLGEFLPTMLHGILAHAGPREAPLCAMLHDEERVAQVLQQTQVLVYASGSEDVLAYAPDGVPAFEYLHTPDPESVTALRALLHAFGPDDLPGMSHGERREEPA